MWECTHLVFFLFFLNWNKKPGKKDPYFFLSGLCIVLGRGTLFGIMPWQCYSSAPGWETIPMPALLSGHLPPSSRAEWWPHTHNWEGYNCTGAWIEGHLLKSSWLKHLSRACLFSREGLKLALALHLICAVPRQMSVTQCGCWGGGRDVQPRARSRGRMDHSLHQAVGQWFSWGFLQAMHCVRVHNYNMWNNVINRKMPFPGFFTKKQVSFLFAGLKPLKWQCSGILFY